MEELHFASKNQLPGLSVSGVGQKWVNDCRLGPSLEDDNSNLDLTKVFGSPCTNHVSWRDRYVDLPSIFWSEYQIFQERISSYDFDQKKGSEQG